MEFCESVERESGAVDLSSKEIQNPEGQGRLGQHELFEVLSAEKADPRACAGGCGEGVGLVTDDGGEAEEGVRQRLRCEKRLVPPGNHTERDAALVKNMQTRGGIVLPEERAVLFADQGTGMLPEHAYQFWLRDKCLGVDMKQRSVSREEAMNSLPRRNTLG